MHQEMAQGTAQVKSNPEFRGNKSAKKSQKAVGEEDATRVDDLLRGRKLPPSFR